MVNVAESIHNSRMFYFCCVKCPKLRLFCVRKDRVPRRVEKLENSRKVMEQVTCMGNWPKAMELCYQSWNFALKLY